MRRVALVVRNHPAIAERLLLGATAAPRPPGGAFVRLFDALAPALAWQPDGLLVDLPTEELEEAIATGLPVVAVTEDPCGVAAHAVSNDETAIGALAARHLLGLGFRHFAFLAQGRGGVTREAGWKAALAVADQRSVSLRLEGVGDDAARLRGWLAGLPRPLGLFCYNDIFGLEALEACQVLGLAVPTAVSVVGADDFVMAQGGEPQLSSVQVPYQAVAHLACERLYALLGGPLHANRIRLPPGGLVVRPSSDTSAIADEVVARSVTMIRNDAADISGIDALAARLGIARRTLERRFRLALGRSPLEEIQRVRIERSCQALALGRTLASASEEAGFNSLSAFQRTFTKVIGQTPSAYQARYSRI